MVAKKQKTTPKTTVGTRVPNAWLYINMQHLMSELAKVTRGKGDETKIRRAVEALVDSGANPEAIAELIDSAGAAAAQAANRCKECSRHATQIAKATLDDFAGA